MECPQARSNLADTQTRCIVCGRLMPHNLLNKLIRFLKPHTTLASNTKKSSDGLALDAMGFYLKIDAVSDVCGQGALVYGQARGGSLIQGDEVMVTLKSGSTKLCKVLSLKRSGQVLSRAQPGDKISIILANLFKDDIVCGSFLRQV